MRIDVFQITSVIFFACKPAQSFLVNIDSKRIDWSNSHINSKVPLEAIDQQWIGDVLLNHAGCLSCATRHLVKAWDDLNTFALTRCFRLHNPKLVLMFSHFRLQLLILLRTVKGEWHEVEVLVSVEGLHPRVTLVKTVLPCNLIAAREVVYTLEPAQIAVNVTFDNTSAPYQYHLIWVQKITIRGCGYVVKIRGRHAVVLHRLFEPLLF